MTIQISEKYKYSKQYIQRALEQAHVEYNRCVQNSNLDHILDIVKSEVALNKNIPRNKDIDVDKRIEELVLQNEIDQEKAKNYIDILEQDLAECE